MTPWPHHLLGIEDLSREAAVAVLDAAESMPGPVPGAEGPLTGRAVALVFFENSTRTRLSFALAAQSLGATVLHLDVATSSVAKGESFRDTLESVDALGVDVVVLRHRSSGAAVQASRWVAASVVNAGDGQHEHPTQALLDAFTIRRAFGGTLAAFEGLRVAMVGDVRHSRVARSNVHLLAALGARVTLVAPEPMLPVSLEGWPIDAATGDLDAVLPSTQVCYVLRIQHERLGSAYDGLGAYRRDFGLTVERAARLPAAAVVLHPGPMNRGVEIDSRVADAPVSLMRDQVAAGVRVRMAVFAALARARSERRG